VKIWKIDVLVNNTGGIGVRARFEEMTTKEYKFVMALNLDSVFYASRAASFLSAKVKMLQLLTILQMLHGMVQDLELVFMQFLKEEYNQSLER
jgi:NAD(P)-dependent dehydrogenase (short-subunit alcohol dehydrogenase family)